MQPGEVLAFLLALAGEAGITVKHLPAGAREDAVAQSGACVVHGRPWLLLAPDDPDAAKIAAAVAALRAYAPSLLEERYLPPAVRAALEGA
jgi:hypothetical protein